MKWDLDAKDWVPENPGRGLPNNKYPEKGLANTKGYDADGKRLPYANYRPELDEQTVNTVYERAKDDRGEVWVDTVDRQLNYAQKITPGDPPRRRVVWEPGTPRSWRGGAITENMWDMGHTKNNKYSEIHTKYLNGQMSADAFLKRYNNPNLYRVEDPARNRHHLDE